MKINIIKQNRRIFSDLDLGRRDKLKKEMKGGKLIFKICIVTYVWENTGSPILQNKQGYATGMNIMLDIRPQGPCFLITVQ